MAASSCHHWVLIEASLDSLEPDGFVYFRVEEDGVGRCTDIPLPVLPNGRIHEIILLPRDGMYAGLYWPGGAVCVRPFSIEVRHLSWFERTWRMANRVIDAFIRLTADLRVLEGLTVWKMLFDLPGAYRIATQFRFCSSYMLWVEHCDQPNDQSLHAQQDVAALVRLPHFHVVVSVDTGAGEYLAATLASLRRQLYHDFSCIFVSLDNPGEDAFDLETALPLPGVGSCIVASSDVDSWLMGFNPVLGAHVANEWVMLLPAGAVLAEHALCRFAREILRQSSRAVFYADDDALDDNGRRCAPRFKPDWSLPHCRETNFLGDGVVLRGSAVVTAGGLRVSCCRHGNYDLLLRVVDAVGDAGEQSVAHIPAMLLHRICGAAEGNAVAGWDSEVSGIAAVRAHLERCGVVAEVSASLPGCRAVRYALPEYLPLVSIIVPTRDAFALLRQCVESVLEKTAYPRYEILVMDNQSVDPEALAYLRGIVQDERVRVLRYDKPFNYSAINNCAVSEAKGDLLCLLNNDTEVISPDWLGEMVSQLAQPRVAAVGAKLYFPDGRIQHAGVVVGPGGCANHLHAFIAGDDPGYCNRASVAQDLQAVTAACLLTRRDLYLEVGGLDEKYLKVAFNDVDYCLRLRAAGYRVVWTPHAELYHHESVSRGKDTSWRKYLRAEREVAVMRRRWKHLMLNDPFYNPNLNYMRPDFTVTHLARSASSICLP
jgi:GT2 family glycosyltransferase